MAAFYGAAFARQWENTNLAEVKAVWAYRLGGFTAAQMVNAITACESKPYPPNLPEFLELCRNSANQGSGFAPLPSPEIPPEVIASRRAALGEFVQMFGRRCDEN